MGVVLDTQRVSICALRAEREPNECRIETMHRMIMEAYCGPDDRFIGHTDGNNLNNQRSKLHWNKRRRRPPRDLPGGVGIPALGTRTNTRWPAIRREEAGKA
jgi:hypothetical protein